MGIWNPPLHGRPLLLLGLLVWRGAWLSEVTLDPARAILRRARHRRAWHLLAALVCLAGLVSPPPVALALEKYGGGKVQSSLPEFEAQEEQTLEREKGEREAERETLVRGYVLTAPFLDNPSFTARPNNTGRVALRHDVHLETDLIPEYLTVYTDQNFFSDRMRGSIKLSEWDTIYGVSGLLGRHWGWLVQYERDAPLDRSGLNQVIGNVIVTYRTQTDRDWPWWRRTFPNQPIHAYLGPGYIFLESHYFARPDNTGIALFRYIGHVDVGLYRDRVVLFGDMNMFTDREARSIVRPSELDWIIGIAVRWRDMELSLYREQDRPLDRSGFVQQYIAVQLRIALEVKKWWRKEERR